MIKVKKSGFLWLIFAILFLCLAGLSGWTIKVHRDYQSIPSEHPIGNRVSNVNALKAKGLPFSFLVIGDTHNSNRATTLIERALKEGNSSFMVILGDFVNKPDLWNHRFFLYEMAVEIKPPFPVFLVPGNHDIDYTSKIRPKERSVTPKIYESLYGSRDFHFVFNNCLFIICGIDPKNPASYLDYLRDTLTEKGKGKRYLFVFMHHPPKATGVAGSFFLPKEEDFFSLLETYHVTSCFFGDFHGYWRGERKGTNLIVSGGSGAIKSWQPVWGRFHHILRITVDENMISEGMMVLSGEVSSFTGTLKKWTFIHLFPVIDHRDWILYVFVLLFLCAAIYSVIIAVLKINKSRLGGRCV